MLFKSLLESIYTSLTENTAARVDRVSAEFARGRPRHLPLDDENSRLSKRNIGDDIMQYSPDGGGLTESGK